MARRWSFPVLMLVGAQAILGATVPMAVSPGSSNGAVIDSVCPSFSWSAIEGAAGYELVVYRVGEVGAGSRPVLEQSFPGAVFSWTPSLDRCFARGGRYAWAVRAAVTDGVSGWSAPNLFEVPAGPSEAEFENALEVVRIYLGSRTAGGIDQVAASDSTSEGRGESEAGSPGRSAAPPATQLTVDGNVHATSFSGAGDLLTDLAPENLTTGSAGIDITGTATNVTGVVALANGGTGATDASGARTNLGVADGAHTIDTTCLDGAVNCNFAGAAVEGGAALSGDSATAFFTTGQIEEPRIADEIARDSEVGTLGASVWSLTGNSGMDGEFLGTTNNSPVNLHANSTPLMRLAVDSVAHVVPSESTPLGIPDNNPTGLIDTISVDDLGTAVGLDVSVSLRNSDISTIRLELIDPNAVPYVLYDGGSSGTSLEEKFPKTPIVSGDLGTWIGENPQGIWTLKVIDSGYLNDDKDGDLNSWNIEFQTLTDPNVDVSSRLAVSGDLDVAGTLSGDGSELTNLDPTELSAGTAPINISGNAATATTVASGAIGETEVDSSEVQLRVAGTCPAGSSIRTISETGTVTCEWDSDSGGDITGISTSGVSGLDGGCSSGTCVLSVDPAEIMEPAQNHYTGPVMVTSPYLNGETVISKSITVPRSGTLFAIASSTVVCHSCPTYGLPASVYYRLTTVESDTPSSGEYSLVGIDPVGGSYPDEVVVIHDVFSIGAGTTTVYFRAGVGSADLANFITPSISLIFIPD